MSPLLQKVSKASNAKLLVAIFFGSWTVLYSISAFLLWGIPALWRMLGG